MARINPDRILTSIDVGTTKICVLIAHQIVDDSIEILGIGKAPSDGLSKGVVVDVAKTVRSIKTAIQEAQIMAGVEIVSAGIGISGAHIRSINSHGLIPLVKGQVRPCDVAQVLDAAKAVPIAEGLQVLHVLPQYFVIDGREKVHDPTSLHGVRLEVQAHIILGAITSVQNLVSCCQMAGVEVNDIVLEPLASADAVLSRDERELGVGLLDIGGGTADLALYQHGSIRHTAVLPVAGNHFTNDLAIGLRTTLESAECIKKEFGCVIFPEKSDKIEVEMAQGDGAHKDVSLQKIVDIVRPRAHELYALAHEEILKHNLGHFMATGLVLTGGGSLLHGMDQLAEEVFNVPVRVGLPRVEFALPELLQSPIYATGYGLLKHSAKKQHDSHLAHMSGPFINRIVERMKSWVLDFF